jgi:hypothetical protein
MIAYWSGRLYLLFPLIALDEPAPLARSLAMTRGRAWRILWVASAPIVADVLVEIAIGVLVEIAIGVSDVALAATAGADHLRLLLECVRAGISALAELCMICAIGLVYLRLANVPSPRRDAHSRAAARHSPSAIIRLPPTARPGRSAAMLPRMMPMPRMTR